MPAADAMAYVVEVGVTHLARRRDANIRRFSCISNESEIMTDTVDETQLRLLSRERSLEDAA